MNRVIFKLFQMLIILIIPLVVTIGCTEHKEPVKPDNGGFLNKSAVIGIVPKHGSEPHMYCDLVGDRLRIKFRNSGELPSSHNKIKVNVSFQTSIGVNEETKLMPAIQPDQTVNLDYEIPPHCFNSDCFFTIKWSNQPSVLGVCIG